MTGTNGMINMSRTKVNNKEEELRETFRNLEIELNESAMERKDEVRGICMALLSNNHVFLLGHPGTAKSLLLDNLCDRMTGNGDGDDNDGEVKKFTKLLTRFTEPNEIFGPVMLTQLKKDNYVVNTEGMLPEAHLFNGEEFWKANSSIQNGLLTILNERKFDNGSLGRLDVPLRLAVISSNETPQDEECNAIYDRICLRYNVNKIQANENFDRLLTGDFRQRGDVETTFSLDELDAARDFVVDVEIPKDVRQYIRGIDIRAHAAGLRISERRHRQVVECVKANAWLEGRDTANKMDLLPPYTATIWKHVEEIESGTDVVEDLVAPTYKKAKHALRAIRQAKLDYDEATVSYSASKGGIATEAMHKVNKVISTFTDLLEEAADDEKDLIERVQVEAIEIQQAMIARKTGRKY